MERDNTTLSPSATPGTTPAQESCSCAEARAHLEAFLDHECEADLSERLRAHVRTCPYCSRVADAERHLRQILRSRCAEQAPDSLRERVLRQLSGMRCGSVDLPAGEVEVRTTSVSRTVQQVIGADGVVTTVTSRVETRTVTGSPEA